jgi:protein-S-isoprenylcysteine O-methyltransferase Ste14
MSGSRFTYYLFILAMTLLDAVLLRSPNLLGKIGLWIYKYHYLRTFPKTLLTVLLVVGVAIVLAELIRFGVRRAILKRRLGKMALIFFLMLAVMLLVKTGMDFSSGTYSQTGIRFRIGACLLPAILMIVFSAAWITLPTADQVSTKLPDDHVH